MKLLNHIFGLALVCVGLGFAADMQSMQTRDWKGRAILMARDPRTQEWNVLLAHNKHKADNWADFSENSHSRGLKGNILASHGLKAQTSGIYDIDIATALHYYKRSDAGDIFHFIPVGREYNNIPFISGGELYRRVKQTPNQYKDDFAWIPVSQILNRQPIFNAFTNKKIIISHGVYHFIRQNIEDAIKFITQKKYVGAVAQQAAGTGNWGPNKPGHIYFYKRGDKYFEFTNFYESPVVIDGVQWQSNEHYFQAQKYPGVNGARLRELIRVAPTARDAFTLGRDKTHAHLRSPQWDTVKYAIMLKAVRAKFSGHPQLKNLLLSTGNSILVEDAGANDTYWGAGADYNGTNALGQILMQVRQELK